MTYRKVGTLFERLPFRLRMHSRKRYVYKQKGRGGYSNGTNPNQEVGSFYQNGQNPNQEGGFVNPRIIRFFRQLGGSRTIGSLERMYAAEAMLSLANNGNTPLRRPGTRGKPRNINQMLNNMLNDSTSPLQADTPDATPLSSLSSNPSPVGDFSPVDSPEYTLGDFSPPHVKHRKSRRVAGGRKRKRTAMDNENLLMVKQFKIANPTAKVNDLHALSGGWKLHGNALGEERKGYRAACLRMGALLAEKMYSNPSSSWMHKMRNGQPFDLLEEYNKLKKSPMATSNNVVAAAVADTIAHAVTTKSRSKRKKSTSPIVGVRRSNRERKAPVMFGRGRNQKGGFLPLLALAAPALAGTLGKLF